MSIHDATFNTSHVPKLTPYSSEMAQLEKETQKSLAPCFGSIFRSRRQKKEKTRVCELIKERIKILKNFKLEDEDKLWEISDDISHITALCGLLKKSGAQKQAKEIETAVDSIRKVVGKSITRKVKDLNTNISEKSENIKKTLSKDINYDELGAYNQSIQKIHAIAICLNLSNDFASIDKKIDDLNKKMQDLANNIKRKPAAEKRAEAAANAAQSAAKNALEQAERARLAAETTVKHAQKVETEAQIAQITVLAKKAQEAAAKREKEAAAKKAQEDAAKKAQEDAAKKAEEAAAAKREEDAALAAKKAAAAKIAEEMVAAAGAAEVAEKDKKIKEINEKLSSFPSTPISKNVEAITSVMKYQSQSWSESHPLAAYILEKINDNEYKRYCIGYFENSLGGITAGQILAEKMVELLNNTRKTQFTTGREFKNTNINICIPLEKAEDLRSVLLNGNLDGISRKPANQIPFIDPLDEVNKGMEMINPHLLGKEIKSAPEQQATVQSGAYVNTALQIQQEVLPVFTSMAPSQPVTASGSTQLNVGGDTEISPNAPKSHQLVGQAYKHFIANKPKSTWTSTDHEVNDYFLNKLALIRQNKPVALPHYFHATGRDDPNAFWLIIDKKSIIQSTPGMGKGAYVSTYDESSGYGPYTFAFSESAIHNYPAGYFYALGGDNISSTKLHHSLWVRVEYDVEITSEALAHIVVPDLKERDVVHQRLHTIKHLKDVPILTREASHYITYLFDQIGRQHCLPKKWRWITSKETCDILPENVLKHPDNPDRPWESAGGSYDDDDYW